MSLEHIAQATEVFRVFLRKQDLKITRQREILLRRIFEREEHFNAEALEDRVKGDGISKATIYRTLQLLVECGLVVEVDLGDNRRVYEHVFGHAPHDHIVCVDCRKVFEFREADLGRVEREIARKLGFTPVGHHLRIEAACEEMKKHGVCRRDALKLE